MISARQSEIVSFRPAASSFKPMAAPAPLPLARPMPSLDTIPMKSRVLLIGSAVVVALLVLVIALVAGPERAATDAPSPDAPPDVAPTFDPDDALQEGAAPTQAFEDVRRGYTVMQDERYTVMSWERLSHESQFVSEVEQPRARVYFDESRVLEIRADEGSLVAPENKPQSGDLRDNVVITLFEASGRPANLETDEDVQLRVYLNEAAFDLELGHVASEGPVQVTGPRVDFRGRGLSLTYNELRRRIEYLEITHGEVLRFVPGTEQEDRTTAEAPPRERGPRQAQASPQPKTDAGPEQLEQPTQFYQAVFHEDVRVRVEDGSAAMDADQLQAVFSLTGSDAAAAPPAESTSTSFKSPAPATAASRLLPLPAHIAALALAQPGDVAASRSLTGRSEQDVVVTWSGTLVVTPLAESPEQLGPQDVRLALLGQPARARTGDEQTIVAARIEYLTSTGRLQAQGAEGAPLLLTSPEIGELTGHALSINQHTGEGYVTGPGSIRAATASAASSAEAAPPKDLHVTWQDRLDLAFYLKGEASADAAARSDSPLASGSQLAGLRTATFRGGVVANHPQFDLRGQVLSLALDAPTEAGSSLREIDAAGDVSVRARGETPDETLAIDCAELAIALEADESGAAHPRHLLAKGDVHAQRPDLTLDAQSLDVELGDAPADADGTAAAGVRRMEATGGVRVVVREPEATLTGERLAIDVDADQLELFGNEDAPAEVIQPQATLRGRHIVMHQTERAVLVNGPGDFEAQMNPDDPADRLAVVWDQSLRYEDASNLAQFTGNVKTTTRDAVSRTMLTCEDLRLDLTQVNDGAPPSDADAANAAKRVRYATADGDVLFVAERFEASSPDTPTTMIRLEGPTMNFDGETQQVHVPGQGRMLLQDLRPAEADDASTASVAGVSFAGRGDSLFTWEKQLILDAARNRVTMEQAVQMVHRPGSDGEMVHLNCQLLTADLQDAQGINVWSDAGAADPGVESIEAHGMVQIAQGERTVVADHLAFTAAEREVVLWAEPGALVRVSQQGQPTPLTAQSFIWDLTTDRLEARRLGPTTAPILRR